MPHKIEPYDHAVGPESEILTKNGTKWSNLLVFLIIFWSNMVQLSSTQYRE